MKQLTTKDIQEIAAALDKPGVLVYVHSFTGKHYVIPDPDSSIMVDDAEYYDDIQNVLALEGQLIHLNQLPSYDAFKAMESFCLQLENPPLQAHFLQILQAQKPFKNFKTEIENHPFLQQQWLVFRQQQLETWIRKQLRQPVKTDVSPNKSPRRLVSSGAKWEDIVGYSRAIRIGNTVEVAGTTAVNENGDIVGLGDSYQQTVFIIEKIEKALQAVNARLEHIVRTRIYITNIQQWDAIGKAHGAFFSEIKPAATLVEVKGLIHPDLLVEIEATAIL